MARKSPVTSKRPSRSRRARQPRRHVKKLVPTAVLETDPAAATNFQPTESMQAFAAAYLEAIAEGPFPIRLVALAERAGVTAPTVSVWRRNTPGFNDWLATELRDYLHQSWPAIKAVAVRFALRGSIDHMKFIRDIVEPPAAREPGSAMPHTTPLLGAVIINLPIPPNEIRDHVGVVEMQQVAAEKYAVSE